MYLFRKSPIQFLQTASRQFLLLSLSDTLGSSYPTRERTNQEGENRSNTLRCTADDPCFRKINPTADEETKQRADTPGNTIEEERTGGGGQRDSWISPNSLSLFLYFSLFPSVFLWGRALSRQRWRAAGSIQRLANVISVDVGGKSNASSEPQEKWQPRAKRRREQEFKPANASDLRSCKIIALRRWWRCYTYTHTHTHTHIHVHTNQIPCLIHLCTRANF